MDNERGFLVCVVGQTPQIVTETLYALIVNEHKIVDEVFVITTKEGQKEINRVNLIDKIRQFNDMYNQKVKFTDDNIFVIKTQNGVELADIRDKEESKATAEFMYEITKKIRNDNRNREKMMYCSIAGGRKTMSAYMAIMMSIIGMKGDSLYHVLVSPPEVERSKDFFFPHKDGFIKIGDREYSHSEIKIDLVELSCIKMRDKFPDYLKSSTLKYMDIIEKIQEDIDSAKRTSNVSYSPGDKVVIIKTEKELNDIFSEFNEGTDIDRIHFLVGNSPKYISALEKMTNYAQKDAVETVLLLGETGTGKDMFARYFAYCRKKALFSIQLGSIPKELRSSELFGHKKGAFSGADKDKEGKLLTAINDNNIIFFDEIEKCHWELFSGLNRFVQNKEIVPLGSDTLINLSDKKIIMLFAINEDPDELIKKGRIIQDFYNRIEKYKVHIPPLNERIEDIGLLAKFFIKRRYYKKESSVLDIEDDAIKFLMRLDWSNKNIRVLENRIDDACLNCDSDKLTLNHIKKVAEGMKEREISDNIKDEDLHNLSEMEDREIEQILKMGFKEFMKAKEKMILEKLISNYKDKEQKDIAEMIKLSQSTLSTKLKKYKIRFDD